MIQDLPPEAVGAELGSPYHIPLWSVETLVNELLAIPKAKGFGIGRTRVLNAEMFQTLRSEEHTSELQSLMRISYAVFCLKKKKLNNTINHINNTQTL